MNKLELRNPAYTKNKLELRDPVYTSHDFHFWMTKNGISYCPVSGIYLFSVDGMNLSFFATVWHYIDL